MRVNLFSVCFVLSAYFVITALGSGGCGGDQVPVNDGPTVRKDERWPLVSSEFGEISAVKISDGENGGTLNWINVEKDGDKLQQVVLKRGDIYRLSSETIFYIENNIESYEYQPQKLQIHAIFPRSEYELHNDQVAGVYTGVHDLVLGFDNKVLQSTFNVPQEVIEELRGGEKQPLIVEGQSEVNTSMWDVGSGAIRALLGANYNGMFNVDNKKKTIKASNIFNEDRDVETCFGWSTTVTSKELDVLKHTDFGLFMMNLTKGSMMAPHLNPSTVEIGVVLHGHGVIQVVCPGIASETECKNSRLEVEEGDVFMVPRYHPMAQISFNDDSFVFMGFMLKQKKESPQYLAGKLSILQRLDRKVLEKSFKVRNTTIDWVLSNENKEVIYECISCAEKDVTWGRKQGRGGGRQADKGGRGRARGGWQGEKGERTAESAWKADKEGGTGWQEEQRGEGSGWQEQEGGWHRM